MPAGAVKPSLSGMSERRDLVILGGGLVGMTLALAAAKSGLTSHVIDRASPEELTADGADGRASAISTASWNLFTNIGLADRLDPLGCPIDAIAVTDGMKPGRIEFRHGPSAVTLGAGDCVYFDNEIPHAARAAGPRAAVALLVTFNG